MIESTPHWFEQHFGCRVRDEDLLRLALSHRSVGDRNNERLEFYGDALLGCYISEELYHRFPTADEGQLSRLRVSLVKGATLAEIAREISIGSHLVLGSGEKHGGGRQRDSILADTLEALFGAIAIDRGREACRDAVLRVFAQRLAGLDLSQATKDPKTQLQEYLQARGRPLPVYELVETRGADHEREFTVSCSLSDQAIAFQGVASSRRSAEQAAAGRLFAALEGAA